MSSNPVRLSSDEDVPAHRIASTSHYGGDISLLNYLLQDLRVLARRHKKGEINAEPHQLFTWEVHGLQRRTILCDPDAIQHEADVQFVGFFGDRRENAVSEGVWASDLDLTKDFKSFPGIYSYSSIELVDHYWANLVIHSTPADRTEWRDSPEHVYAVQHIAPRAYHGVRIHNGRVPGGVTGSHPVEIETTKYWDYDLPEVWHAFRVLRDPVKA